MSNPRYKTNCVERFLEYVTIDTQSSEESDTYPSTPGQLDLLRKLRDECLAMGLEDVTMDEHGYVFATLPATSRKPGIPVIGFLAHVDTSPEMSGKDVKAIFHRNYDGGDLVLPDDPSAVITAEGNPALADQMGKDIITASGTTLLGADNKAGVAEIMAAAEYLLAHPEIPHGPVRIGFTPDEEVGTGTKYFDVERFGAYCAYTMDGETLGELQVETFSADSMTVNFHGFNTHPGFARGKMVNAIKVAAKFIDSLPADTLSPETTEAYEGFVHPYTVDAGVEKTSVKFIVRDFDEARAQGKRSLARTTGAGSGAGLSRFKRRYHGRGVLPQYERRAGSLPGRPGQCAGSHPACGSGGAGRADPGRYGWIETVVHGASHAEYFRW